jgi:hypothetical protein
MTLIPKDMTPVYKATIAKGTNAMQWQRAAYVDLLPPCNHACPAGLNIQAWLSLAQAGRYEEATATLSPLPANLLKTWLTFGNFCTAPQDLLFDAKWKLRQSRSSWSRALSYASPRPS